MRCEQAVTTLHAETEQLLTFNGEVLELLKKPQRKQTDTNVQEIDGIQPQPFCNGAMLTIHHFTFRLVFNRGYIIYRKRDGLEWTAFYHLFIPCSSSKTQQNRKERKEKDPAWEFVSVCVKSLKQTTRNSSGNHWLSGSWKNGLIIAAHLRPSPGMRSGPLDM